MYRRLSAISGWLDQQGIQHLSELRRLQARLAPENPALLAEFASVLEPVKGYTRHRTRKYLTTTPLNRLVDAVAPESDAARQFNAAVDTYLRTGAGATELDARLTAWRSAALEIQPVLLGNQVLQEDAEVASALVSVCTIGLEALDSAGTRGNQSQLDSLGEGAKAKADLLIQIVPGVRALVESAHRSAGAPVRQ
jgi:hexosaminidase